MEPEHEQQVQEIENDIDGVRGEVGVLRSRVDRHLEIYANNGKEMKRMGDLLEQLKDRFDRFELQTKPIVDVYNGVITLRSVVVGVASVVLALGAIGAGVIWAINAVIQK